MEYLVLKKQLGFSWKMQVGICFLNFACFSSDLLGKKCCLGFFAI